MIPIKRKFYISIFIIWLFTVSGIIGIGFTDAKDWFLALTPVNLLVTFFVLFFNIDYINIKAVIALLIPAIIGFVTEALGVNYGLIFGDYIYGDNLGYKIMGVPLTICLNWTLLTVASFDVAHRLISNRWLASFLGGVLMTVVDIVIEVSAPRFDFWEFENNIVPLQNYIGWFVIGFIANLVWQSFKIKTNPKISFHVFVSIAIFFMTFLFI